jgi:hypothetical protein
MATEHPQFLTHVDHAVNMLRERLLADVQASAQHDRRSGGIRADWKALVRRLTVVRARIGPAPFHPSSSDPHS